MLKKIKKTERHNQSSKNLVANNYNLNSMQLNKLDSYFKEIRMYNKHTNIVGKSTLVDFWNNHVLDCIQISNFIKSKNSTILDVGTGAGLPGIILSINNFKNVSLADSNSKKILFVKNVCSKLNINSKIYCQRIESLINFKFDYLVARAVANLNKLIFYSYKLPKKRPILIFLKGKNIHNEIREANKHWKFHYKLHKSASDERGNIIVIKKYDKINA